MKLLIDTVNEDLYMSLIKGNKTIAFAHLVKHKKKSEILPAVFKKLIMTAEITAKDIKNIYVVNGPGSFMGVRAGMTFAKTMSLVTKANLFGINNLRYISQGNDGTFYVDAKGKKSYIGMIDNGELNVFIGHFKENSFIDYNTITKNPEIVLQHFKKIKDIVNYEANYVKDPQIGGA